MISPCLKKNNLSVRLPYGRFLAAFSCPGDTPQWNPYCTPWTSKGYLLRFLVFNGYVFRIFSQTSPGGPGGTNLSAQVPKAGKGNDAISTRDFLHDLRSRFPICLVHREEYLEEDPSLPDL